MKFRVLVCAWLLGACTESGHHPSGGTGAQPDAAACQDQDGDGFGEGCEKGGDCNDKDPKVHTGCAQCTTPQEGCDCADGAKPVSCYLTPSADEEGTVMCHEGTRYCRAHEWSDCESIKTYPRPQASATQELIRADAGPVHCNDCNVDCFVVRDTLDPADAGSISSNTVISDGGGLSLKYTLPDASTMMMPGDASVFDPSKCVLGTAPDHDCDGIPDQYDPYPDQKPFATANPTLFLDIAPGETGTGVVKLQFFLNSADVYFLVDQTGSMAGERDRLVTDLTTGDFINNAAYNCADYDFDFKPNNELKAQGIVGAIRCIIRDANFGVGYFREIPFYPYYAPPDSIAYRNLQDITSSIPSIISGVGLLNTVTNIDWPEDDMVGLYSVVTGSGMYFGMDKPGYPSRTCSGTAWGYPCFRANAIPIVLMFTDAPLHNGPSNNTQPYNSSYLGINQGTTTSFTSVTPTNENTATAYDLGDLTNAFYSYIGNTTTMTSDLGHTAVTCGSSSSPASPDAMFKFTVSSTKTIKLSTEGSDFDTTLSLYRGAPGIVTVLPAMDNSNDNLAMPYAFGDAANRYVKTTGSTSALTADFSANDQTCSANPQSKDAAFTFNLSQATHVALDTSGSAFGTTIGLYSSAPPTNSYTPVSNTNDTFATAYNAGTLNGKNLGFSGDSSASGILATYTGAQLGCASPPVDTATDAVYSFTLTSPTKVRVSAEDTTFASVIGLVDSGSTYLTSTTSANTNEIESSATSVGALDGRVVQYTGNTSSMAANYSQALIGCGAADTSRDAVYKFTLSSPQTVSLDTTGSTMDTVLALFNTSIVSADTAVAIASNTNETGLTAKSLGTVNNKRYVVTGGSTSAMLADYTSTQTGCSTINSSSPDAVFKFHLDTATRVRLDTIGTSYDAQLSLHNGPLPDAIVTAISPNTNENVATARAVALSSTTPNLAFTGTTTAMTADIPIDDSAGCSANNSAPDAVFQLTVPSAGNYEINTVGSAIDTVLGLYPSTVSNPSVPTPTAENAAGDKKASAVNVGTLDGRWLSFTGSTSTLVNDLSFSSCSATSTSKDAFYKFTLATARTVTIDTIGSAFDTVIGLFNYSTDAQLTCDNDSGGGTASKLSASLAAGTYYVLIKAKGTSTTAGAYQITFRDDTVSNTNLIACDNDSGGGTTSKLTRSLTAGTYYVVVKGLTATTKGAYKLAVKATDLINSANRLSCDDDSAGASQAQIEQNLVPGDYYAVVKGHSTASSGTYTLTVQDMTMPPQSSEISCNDDVSMTNNTSFISQSLAAGTYVVVLKGHATSSGAYTLRLSDASATTATTLQCDYNSGAGATPLIERNLNAGTYRVIFKGKASTNKGAYKVILRDLTAIPSPRIGCDHNSGSGGKSHYETDLTPGAYTVVLKGDTTTAAGAYSLSVRDASNYAINDTPINCDDNSGYGNTSIISTSLTPGTYYAAVKGYHTYDVGQYQLNVGGATVTTGTYTPPTWAQTLAALQAKSVRVLSVLSCQDDPAHGNVQGDCNTARTQVTALANATSALGANLQPLVFDINGDGSGLSTSIVNGVTALAHYLSMDVQIRVVYDPDPNPGFNLVVTAVDAPGDGCSGVVGLEHKACAPGASPRFDLAFTNPTGSPVKPNPNDPNGGYNFRAELIGDNEFIVDKVPIYIIPKDVTHPPASVPQVATSGTYWQDVAAPGCTGNQRPDWHDLIWTADVPTSTTISFGVCASDKTSDLNNCSLIPLCTVTGGNACTKDADCANGFCSTGGNCQTITAGTCANNSQCSNGSTCNSGKCTFTGQPIYIGGVLGSANYSSNLKMQIGMTGDSVHNTGPTLHNWSLTYVCNNIL